MLNLCYCKTHTSHRARFSGIQCVGNKSQSQLRTPTIELQTFKDYCFTRLQRYLRTQQQLLRQGKSENQNFKSQPILEKPPFFSKQRATQKLENEKYGARKLEAAHHSAREKRINKELLSKLKLKHNHTSRSHNNRQLPDQHRE